MSRVAGEMDGICSAAGWSNKLVCWFFSKRGRETKTIDGRPREGEVSFYTKESGNGAGEVGETMRGQGLAGSLMLTGQNVVTRSSGFWAGLYICVFNTVTGDFRLLNPDGRAPGQYRAGSFTI